MKKWWSKYMTLNYTLALKYSLLLLVVSSCTTKRVCVKPKLYAMTSCGRSWDSYYFTDKWGNSVAHEKRFRMAYQFSNGLACVQEPNERGKWGYVDEKLELVIPYQFDCAGSFGSMYEDNYTWVKFDLDEENRERSHTLAFGPAMIINKSGQRVSKVYGFMHTGSMDSYGFTIVNDGRNFKSTVGFHTFSTDGLWGGINGKGEEIIPCVYEFMIATDRDVFLVRKDGLWGAINNKGKVLVPPVYNGVVYNCDTYSFDSYKEIDNGQLSLSSNLEHGKFNFISGDGVSTVVQL